MKLHREEKRHKLKEDNIHEDNVFPIGEMITLVPLLAQSITKEDTFERLGI